MRSPDRKRYGWHRRYNGFVGHPKWRVVATMTTLPVTQVIAVVDVICETANNGRPRGSLAEFSILECGAVLDMRPDHVRRIYAALEELGWIDREYLVTWDERQPDKEDPTAKDRQQRRRDKIREQNQFASRRDKRDVTPRQDLKSYRENLSVAGEMTAEEFARYHQTHAPLSPVLYKRRGNP